MLRLLAIASTIAFSGCASSRPCNPSAYDIVGESMVKHVGLTSYCEGKIRLDPRCDSDVWFARHVAAHELGHIICGSSHILNERCFMQPGHSPGDPPILSPTKREIDRAVVTETKTIRLDRSLSALRRDAVIWAVEVWNKALGKKAFAVE